MRITIAVAIAALVLAAGATAAAKPPVGWTVAKADAQVTANVRIPFCRIYSAIATFCKDGKPTAEGKAKAPLRVSNVVCRGVESFRIGTTQKYRRLTCDWAGNNGVGGKGSLSVYVSGVSTFRWKSV